MGDSSNPDSKKELDCGKVMFRCWGELLYILTYLTVILIVAIGLNYQLSYGKPQTIAVQFAIAFAIDQAKSFPCQLFIYWLFIRRLGFAENVHFEVWDDEVIAEADVNMSLLFFLRKTVADFLEHRIVSRFILGMVICLCVVIFSELAIAQQEAQYPVISQIYYVINFILLSFFMLEIVVKLFAYGHIFLYEFTNVFDSCIVIISFIMQVMNLKAKEVSILRVLRLIKVIIEMKKVADRKKE